MALTIDFFNQKTKSFSQSMSTNVGKRIIIVGSNERFDSSGYVTTENSSADNTSLDFVPIRVASLDTVKSAYGENNDLCDAYLSAYYGGQKELSIIKIPYSRAVVSESVLTDREQFKLNLVSAINTLFERDDFDVCVMASISLRDDLGTLQDIVSSMTNKNITKLILVNATLNSDSVVWDETIESNLTGLLSLKSDMLKNMCIVCNNEQYDASIGAALIPVADYPKIDKAAYVSGLMVSSDKHPSLSKSIFNSIGEQIIAPRVTYFRENKIRGIVLSNFKTLGSALDSKNTLSSAINVYRASAIASEIKEALRPLIGTPIRTDSKFGTYLSADETIKRILEKYISLGIITEYNFNILINQVKMLMDVSIEIVMCYELEAIKIVNTVGV